MKKTLLLSLSLMAALCGNAQYTTAGDGTTYTLSALAAIEGSGLTADGSTYTLADDLIIAAGDIVTMGNGESLLIAPGKSLDVAGDAVFNATEMAFVGAADFDASPIGIRITDNGTGQFTNVMFFNASIIQLSEGPIVVNECQFTEVTSASNSQGAISFVHGSEGNVISNSYFYDNKIPAIATGGNTQCGLTIENCEFDNCNTDNTNKPMLNLTAPAEESQLIIKNNVVKGAKLNMVGGMSVANMMSMPAGNVLIEGNDVRDCRYGLNLQGPFPAQVRNNAFIDNRYESNPMNGGSGISCTAFANGLDVIISGNRIEGNMWGITLISYSLFYPDYYGGFKFVSLGEPGNTDIDSPGENIFKDNGNDGTVYDASVPYALYNNSDCTLYAQNNDWGVPEEEIATVIFDRADNPALGEVIYAGGTDGVNVANTDSEAKAEPIYDLQGRNVNAPAHGLYITPTRKIAIK